MYSKTIVVGHLAADPQTRYTPSGRPVCKFAVITNYHFTGSDGQLKEKSERHNIAVWGKRGETCQQYLAKGRLVLVEGRQETSSYEKNGQTQYWHEIIASDVRFLSKRVNGHEVVEDGPDPSDEMIPEEAGEMGF